MRHVLVIAYYFPPMGLSGVQRTAKFVKYLPEFGWHPTVLTVQPGGYFAYDEALLDELQGMGIEVLRTASIDPTRLFHDQKTVKLPQEANRKFLSLISQFFFIPDNKIGWAPFALWAGRGLLKRRSFDLIFSSAPPYTGHLIARRLSRTFKVPLIVDFRDDWVGNPRHVYPTRWHRWMHQRLELSVLRASRQTIAINTPIRNALIARNRSTKYEPCVTVLPQGYDAEDFTGTRPEEGERRMRFVYSGVFYDAQTPDYFLRALRRMVELEPELRASVQAVFVGLVPDSSKALVQDLGIGDLVRYTGYLSHTKAVQQLHHADVLWMTIGRRPGSESISTSKLFEYFGARKPILALVPRGAAHSALESHGAACMVEPDDIDAIVKALRWFITAWMRNRLPVPDEAYVSQFERRRLTEQLAAIFEASIV